MTNQLQHNQTAIAAQLVEFVIAHSKLMDRNRDLEQDVISYKRVAVAMMTHAYDLNVEIKRQRRTIEHLRAQIRTSVAPPVVNAASARRAA